MTTLTTTPVAPLLDRLFDEAATASPATSPALAGFSPAERSRLMRSKTDYRDFYGRLKDFPLAVSRKTGALLYMHGMERSETHADSRGLHARSSSGPRFASVQIR